MAYKSNKLVEFTPTIQGAGTISNVNFFYTLKGKELTITGTFTSGTATGDEARLYLPSGFTIDSRITSKKIVGYHIRNSTGAYHRTLIGLGGNNYVTWGIVGAGAYEPFGNHGGATVFDASSQHTVNLTVYVN